MPDSLVLKYDNLSTHVAELFDDLSAHPARREQFVTDPAGEIARAVLPALHLAPSRVGQANRLMYALLTNAGFLAWAKSSQAAFEAEAKAAHPDLPAMRALGKHAATVGRAKLLTDLTQAFRTFVDRELLVSLLGLSYEVPAWLSGSLEGPQDPTKNLTATLDRALADVDEAKARFEELMQHSTFAVAETAVAIIAVAVIFILVTAVDFTPFAPREMLSRMDLQKLTTLVADQLEVRALELRKNGFLVTPYKT